MNIKSFANFGQEAKLFLFTIFIIPQAKIVFRTIFAFFIFYALCSSQPLGKGRRKPKPFS